MLLNVFDKLCLSVKLVGISKMADVEVKVVALLNFLIIILHY